MAKTAFVTGASSGIGKGIALCLAREGYDIAFNYNKNRMGAQDCIDRIHALGRSATAYECDLSVVSNIRALFERFDENHDRLDLLVNNAGITRWTPFLQMEEGLFDEILDTNLRGTYFCAQAACRRMVEKGIRGVIVNISSSHDMECYPGLSAYAASKAAITKFTKNCALEMGPYGIRVVGISPSWTLLEEQKEREGFDENSELYKDVSAYIPLNRYAHPEEIGEAVVFLASEKASYITGTTIVFDGGASLSVAAMGAYGFYKRNDKSKQDT